MRFGVLRATSRSCSRSRAKSLALALCLALSASARADEPWVELYRAEDVTVSERAAPPRALPDFRGEVELAADPYDVLAVILDVPGQTEWMWQCRVSRLLHRESDSVTVVYQQLDVQWPATDRDVVFRSVVRVLEPGKRLEVRFANRDDPAAPPVPELVRMPRLEGAFELAALDASHTRVTYTVSADPGGSLPTAILRQTVRESPFDTLVGLRRRVAETRGRYANVAADWRSRPADAR